VSDEVRGEKEGQKMTIKFLVIAKNTGKGKVLTWVDYLTACFCGALKPVLCR